MRYYLQKIVSFDGESFSLIGIDDNGIQYGIPYDDGNADYQHYLQWLEEGNEPEPWPNSETK